MMPEITALYNEYTALGRKLYDAVKPTLHEIQHEICELEDLGINNYLINNSLCEPGDAGLIASLVYETRVAKESV